MGWEGGEGRVRIGRGEWRYKIKGVLELVKIIGLPSSQNNFIYFIAVNFAERFGSVAFFYYILHWLATSPVRVLPGHISTKRLGIPPPPPEREASP